MPSQLVDEVRRMVRDREEAGRPITALERTFILAAVVPRRNMPDLVDELEAALALARRVILGDPPSGYDPALVEERRRVAGRRLIAAARAVLDHDPALEDFDPTANLPDERLRPERADVDG